MADETIIGCASEFHGMVYCESCKLVFGYIGCRKYRNKYDPVLIEDGYFEKFGEHDSRRAQDKSNNE